MIEEAPTLVPPADAASLSVSPDIDIVFLHGLAGDRFSTWTNADEQFWPQVIADTFLNCRVYTCGFKSSKLSSMKTGEGTSIVDLGTMIADGLICRDVLAPKTLFICHSLGGLVVKQMIRKCSDSANKDFNVLGRSCVGVAFLSTPHQGSKLASTLKTILSNGASKQLTQLTESDQDLFDLNEYFRSRVGRKGISVKSFYETEKTWGVQVVDKTSGNPGVYGSDPIGIEGNHITICKPAGTGAPVHQSVCKFIRDHLTSKDGAEPLASKELKKLDKESVAQELVKNTLPEIDRGNLGLMYSEYFESRQSELQSLSRFLAEPDQKVMILRGWGGIGKTSIIHRWLNEFPTNHPGRSAWCFSFYDQGSKERYSTSREFEAWLSLKLALPSVEATLNAHERARSAFQQLEQTAPVLILDGLEPMQFGDGRRYGEIKDDFLSTLIGLLAAHASQCSTLITTRVPLTGLNHFIGGRVSEAEVEGLESQDGRALLRRLGVIGENLELEELSDRFSGHPLSLNLLGTLLADLYDGMASNAHAAQSALLVDPDDPIVDKCIRILKAYETDYLASSPYLRELLLLAALHGRPVSFSTLLRGIGKSNKLLLHLAEEDVSFNQLKSCCRRLSKTGMLTLDVNTVSIHPIVSEYFEETLARSDHSIWLGCHEAWMHVYLDSVPQNYAETIEEAARLSFAIGHGVHAGRGKEMLNRVYRNRLQRRDSETSENKYFLRKRLGAFDLDLDTLTSFYTDPWSRIIPGIDHAYVRNEVGYLLQARGDLEESINQFQSAANLRWRNVRGFVSSDKGRKRNQIAFQVNDWALTVINSAQSLFFLGRLDEALQSLVDCEKSGLWKYLGRTRKVKLKAVQGAAFHMKGLNTEAEAAFEVGEELERNNPNNRVKRLHSFNGFLYHRLLFDKGDFPIVLHRYESQGVPHEERMPGMLSLGLQRYHYAKIRFEEHRLGKCEFQVAEREARTAIENLLKTGRNLAPFSMNLLGRMYREKGDFRSAAEVLSNCMKIVTDDGLLLMEADCLLEQGYLMLSILEKEVDETETISNGRPEDAGALIGRLREIVETSGYGRIADKVDHLEDALESGHSLRFN